MLSVQGRTHARYQGVYVICVLLLCAVEFVWVCVGSPAVSDQVAVLGKRTCSVDKLTCCTLLRCLYKCLSDCGATVSDVVVVLGAYSGASTLRSAATRRPRARHTDDCTSLLRWV